MGYYQIAQICLNGHCITSAVDDCPELSQNFCDICGSKTITSCPSCGVDIRGNYYDEGFLGPSYKPPAYCYSCGAPFPWTEAAISAAKELILEEEALDPAQREQLSESIPDIMIETPKTNLAAIRLKKALKAVGRFTADGIRQFVIDFGCELAKKQLGL